MKNVDKKIQQTKKAEQRSLIKRQITKNKSKKFKPYKMPADLQLAKLHRKASRFAIPDKLPPKEFATNLCPCCLNLTRNRPLMFCSTSLKSIGRASQSAKEYFQFLIFMICVFVIIFLFFGVPIFAQNPNLASCFLSGCQKNADDIFLKFRLLDTSEDFKDSYPLHFIFVAVLLIFISKYIFFYFLYKQNKSWDKKRKTPGDYTVHFHNLKGSTKAEITLEICNALNKKKIYIANNKNQRIRMSEHYISELSRVHNIHNLTELTSKYVILIKKKKIKEKKGKNNTDHYKKICKELNEVKEKIKKINQTSKKANFTGEAFVTFTSIKIADQVVQNEWTVLWSKYFSSKPYILKAREPQDIIWGNFGISNWNRLGRIFASYFIAMVLITGSFFLIYGVKKLQSTYKEDFELTLNTDSVIINTGITYGYLGIVVLIITLINWVLRKILMVLSRKEERRFFTELEYSQIFKISVALFLNTGMVILLTTNWIHNQEGQDALFSSNGIIINIQLIMLISLSNPILWTILSPFHFLNWYKRRKITKQLKDPNNKILQAEANQAFEGPAFNYSFRFYSILKTFGISMFYALVIPWGLIIGVIEMLLWYMCDKYVLLKRCKKPIELDFAFTLEMLAYFDMFLFLLPFGTFIFSRFYVNDPSIHVFVLVALVLCFLEGFVIRISVLFKCCVCCGKSKEKDIEYYKVKAKFKSYRQYNPITSTIYKFNRKNKQVSASEIADTKNRQQKEDDGEINLMNIIHLIGTGNFQEFQSDRVYVEDEAFCMQNLGSAQDTPYGANTNQLNSVNSDQYGDLNLNRQANVFFQYQNHFDFDENSGPSYYPEPPTPQTPPPNNGGYQNPQQTQANYFDNFGQVFGQFANYDTTNDVAYYDPVTNQVYSDPNGNVPLQVIQEDQQLPQNNAFNFPNPSPTPAYGQGGGRYSANPNPTQAFNHYGQSPNTGRQYSHSVNPYGNQYGTPGVGNHINYADRNQYENPNNQAGGNYFDHLNQGGNRQYGGGGNPGNYGGNYPYQ